MFNEEPTASAPVVAEEYVDVPAGQVFVKTWQLIGVRDKAPLVLLHDSLGCVTMWREFPATLCARLKRPVIAYDRPGFGRSTEMTDVPTRRFVEEQAKSVFPMLRDALGFDRFALLGHSVGGSMALHIAAAYRDTCSAVITVSAQAFVEPRTLDGIRAAREAFEEETQMRRLMLYHGSKAPWVLAAWIDVWLSREFADWNVFDVLPAVRCPLLAIHGDGDEYGSLQFPQSITAEAGGPATMRILANCGHMPHREQEATVVEAVAEFLDAVDGSARGPSAPED